MLAGARILGDEERTEVTERLNLDMILLVGKKALVKEWQTLLCVTATKVTRFRSFILSYCMSFSFVDTVFLFL